MSEHEWLQDPRWWCVDCSIHTGAIGDYYMVRDEMWERHGAGSGMLCLACLEKRIGRELSGSDFTEALVNTGLVTYRSELMSARVENFKSRKPER